MAKVAPMYNDFSTGEISPRFLGRTDADQYKSALATCLNAFPYPYGPVSRRSGTRYLGSIKTPASTTTKLIPFVFSNDEKYMLEFGAGYVRFWKNRAPVLVSGNPYELSSPFIPTDFAQVDDVIFLVAPSQKPQMLVRVSTSPETWEFLPLLMEVKTTVPVANQQLNKEHPYMGINELVVANSKRFVPENYLSMTMSPSSTSLGAVTVQLGPARTVTSAEAAPPPFSITHVDLTFASAHGFEAGMHVGVESSAHPNIQGRVPVSILTTTSIRVPGTLTGAYSSGQAEVRPAPFSGGDVGRFVRILHSSTWGWGIITAVNTWGRLSVQATSAFGGTSAASVWRLSLLDRPTKVSIHEGRLVLAGYPNFPQRVDLSVINDFANFSPTTSTGAVADDRAISRTLAARESNAIRGMVSQEKGLFVNTQRGDWILRAAEHGAGITPSNVGAKQSANFGSDGSNPVMVNNTVVFIEPTGKRVREATYTYQLDGFRVSDLSLLADHISAKVLSTPVFVSNPVPTVWFKNAAGGLAALGYERVDEQAVRYGWSQHEITGGMVESIASIPSPDGTFDDLWMIVKRTIDGGTKRYIEVLEKPFLDEAPEDAFFVDCGVTSDNGSAITTVTGLAHLEGEEVDILSDGFEQPRQTVTSGQIVLPIAAKKIQVGLPYNSDIQLPRLEAGAANGTSIGKTRRIHKLGVMVHRMGQFKTGPSFADLTEVILRDAGHPADEAVPLFSGVVSDAFDADYDFDNNICIRQDGPFPGTLLAVMPHLVTNDG